MQFFMWQQKTNTGPKVTVCVCVCVCILRALGECNGFETLGRSSHVFLLLFYMPFVQLSLTLVLCLNCSFPTYSICTPSIIKFNKCFLFLS